MHLIQRWLALAALSVGLVLPAHAANEPALSLVFKDPTGTVLATDNIDVWVTLSFSNTEDFTFDLSEGAPNYGLSPSLLPLTGDNGAEFDSFTKAYLYTTRYCSGTFTTGCSGPPYEVNSDASGQGWFEVGDAYTLAAGQTQDFLLYTLTPTGGMAAPGTYQFYNVGLGIAFEGVDSFGNAIESRVEALTCSPFDPSCGFSRVVTAVPEASTWAMMVGGLAFAAGVGRRQRPRLSAA